MTPTPVTPPPQARFGSPNQGVEKSLPISDISLLAETCADFCSLQLSASVSVSHKNTAEWFADPSPQQFAQ